MIRVESTIALTPEELAALYWGMGSDDQAAFFGELYRLAGAHRLCMQTAAVVHELETELADEDVEASNDEASALLGRLYRALEESGNPPVGGFWTGMPLTGSAGWSGNSRSPIRGPCPSASGHP